MVMNKKAAIEMSMSTIITIVFAVVFLILGLTFIRNIYGFATSTTDSIDEKMKTQLSSLFADEDQPIFIKPEDGQLKVRAGTTNFGFIIGARTKTGNDVTKRSDIQYRLVLDKTSQCMTVNKIAESRIKSWFVSSKVASGESDLTYNSVSDYKFDQGFVRVQIDLPSGTQTCSQLVYYDFIDKSDNSSVGLPIGGGSFNIEVLRKSLV